MKFLNVTRLSEAFRNAILKFGLVVALVAGTGNGLTAAEPKPISVGVAAQDITPDYPIRLSGFGSRRTESEGVTMKIWAKALALADEKQGPAIIITVDNVGIPDDIVNEVAARLKKQIGLKRERLTVTVTHTHTAPMLRNVCPTIFGVPIPPEHQEHIDRYTREFTDDLEKVALAAWKDVKPAHLYWGTGTATFSANRRTKGGPVDHDLPVMFIRDLDGKVRGVYFSYACHCVTLSDNKISGDWAGFAQKEIQEMFPGAVALASVGCGADSNPSSGVTGSNVQVCHDQGQQVADEVKRLSESALTPITTLPEIHYARIDLPLAPARSRAEWEARAKRNDAVGYHAKVNLERLDRGEKIPDKLNYPIQSWIFGDDLALVFLPGETVVDYALRLKREFDHSRVWINGYSNDSRCYIPSERILKEGGYEGGDAMIYYDAPQAFAPGLEKKIIDVVHKQVPATYLAAPGTEGSKPRTPSEALNSFKTKPGLEVQLVASEPLVQSPVAIDWSADGKLWVCEMLDYPNGLDQNWQPGGQVKFLEDVDGDGKYDKSTVFVTGLPFPTGITAWGKGVLICAAPDILYAEDTNGDGKADKVEKLFTGFFTDNFQARVNSLSIGLDNWIYAANGLLGGTITAGKNDLWPAQKGSLDIRNHDIRIHPVKGTLEMVSGLTQQGRVRDDWDNWFGCNNSELLLHFPVPERYLRRNPKAPAPDPIRNLTARPDGNRVYPISRLLERFNDPESANRATSACGLGIYRDTWLGEEFAGNAFTCEPVHNLVHREIISPNAAFTAHRAADEKESEFLASTDNWFRPVQARPGPDGALYVVDMYRFLIEHPRWIPAARLAQIDVRAGADKGRIYRVVKKGAELRPIPNLKKMDSEALAAALDSANGIERDRVHVEILTRHDKGVVPGLVRVANESKLPQARAHALSILDGISALEPNMIQAALKNPDAGVRQIAVRLTEPYLAGERKGGKELLKSLAEMTNDPSILVLRQLAFSLGESRDAEAGKVLAALATKWVGNSELRTAILSSSTPHATVVLNAIVNLPAETTGRTEWINPLIATVVDSADRKAIAAAVQMTLPEANHEYNGGKISMLASLLDALDDKKLKVDDFFAKGSQDRARLESAISKAAQIASDENAPIKTRQSAISLLGRGESQAELDRLASFAMSGSQELRRASITALKKEHSPKVAETLLKNWRQASPTARNEIMSSLLMDREEWTVALLHAVKDGVVTANEISLSDRQRLSESPKAQIKDLAIQVLPAMNKSAREDVVNQYKGALTLQGNVTRGAEVFTRNCSTCHLVNGVGHEVGPDLAALRSKDPEYWIKNILDPNAVVEPRFVNYSIELNDDRSLGGLIRGETANSLTIVAGGGVTENVQRSQIKDIRASSLSLMPEGLEQGINVQEMADLVAFLKSGNPRKTVPGNQPELIAVSNGATVLLPAAKAEIYGEQITFEDTFGNIGMWHGTDELVVWTVNVAQPASYDVYLDYACAGNSAGNRFAVVAGDQKITGSVSATGGDWSEYKQIRVGQMNLPSGTIRVELRPDAPLKGALMDVRTVALAPKGKKPQWPKAVTPVTDETVLRDPPNVARFILDPKQSNTARENAVNANPQFAGALIREMTADLKPGSAEEYQRIPWIWRVAITCGKRNDAGQIADVLKVSLPHEGEPLRDWQAVVIGGGIINGISQRGEWPLERINEILQDHPELKKRWDRSLDLAATMTDNEKVPSGTRYDALRMIALLPWEKSGEQLQRYLGHENGELQMGAVSGLADVQNREATAFLVQSFAKLEKGNRDLAFNGLLKSDERRQALKNAVRSGKLSKDLLTSEQLKELE